MDDAVERASTPESTATDAPRLAGARVLVIGMGRSGLAAAAFLGSSGADVLLADTRVPAELGDRYAAAQQLGLELQPGLTDARQLGVFDLAVVSPGLPLASPVVLTVEAAQIVSETELASWYCSTPLIAVSGTNGKGTTSTLLASMLRQSGRTVVVAGNIGSPLVENVSEVQRSDFAVVEVSSFQLEGIRRFRPHVAALLNITPDHLDYHPSLDDYVAAKARLFENQTADDYAVLNADDELVLRAAQDATAQRRLFSTTGQPVAGSFVLEGAVAVRVDPGAEATRICSVDDIPLPGRHNLANVLAASLAAAVCGAGAEAMAQAIRAYRPAQHILERVADIEGVAFVNDTKATNEASAIASLEAVQGPVILIAGGKDKGVDLSAFSAVAAQRAKAVFLIGETAAGIARGVRASGGPEAVTCRSLDEAVVRSADAAQSGDTVLLAPACSSYDMFEDYADRGRQFRDAVKKLVAGERI